MLAFITNSAIDLKVTQAKIISAEMIASYSKFKQICAVTYQLAYDLSILKNTALNRLHIFVYAH